MADDIITDDEFERLLDQLHGEGKCAQSAAPGPAAEGAADAAGPAAPAESAGAPIRLGAELCIAGAGALAADLRGRLGAGSAPLVVDASAVEKVDAAGLQLLACLARSAAEAGASVRFEGASAALRDAAATLDLAGELELG